VDKAPVYLARVSATQVVTDFVLHFEECLMFIIYFCIS